VLTDTKLKKLKPKTKRYSVADHSGLFVEVNTGGAMTWRYRYTLRGRREKVTVGNYPALSLAEARDKRRALEKLVEDGVSPAREAKRERESGNIRTVADLAERFIREVHGPANKAKQGEVYLHRDCLPRLGRLEPQHVTTADVRRCVDAVLNRGHGQAARKVRDVLKRLFEYAESLGLIRGNPALPVKPQHIAPARSRSRVLTAKEIPAFITAIYESRLTRPVKLALHFLLLIPARKGELVAARREHFDLEGGTWDIPSANSKNGAPIRHKLPRQALALVTEMLAASDNEWLLPSSRGLGRKPICGTSINAALRTVEGLPDGMVIHDLRRTIRTGLGELGGVPEAVAELCLNHRPRGVAGIYDRSERIEERAIALQRWADHVDALRVAGGAVTPFRRVA